MIKKGTAIFFILLANIILLAHIVVPHHHHKSQVCLVISHCQTDSQPYNHNSCGHDHQNDGKSSNDCCVLKQVVLIPSNLLRQECESLEHANVYPDFDEFQSALFDTYFVRFVPFESSVSKLLSSPSIYTHFVNNALGLRGPPTV